MSVTDAAGNVRPLVMENEIYYQAEDAYQVPDFPPRHWPAGLAVGIILAALVFVFDIRYKNSSRRGKYLLGSLYLLLGLVFGIPGSVLFLMSLFTNHIVTFYNENLFLANPLTFLLVIAGYGIMRQNKFIVRYIPLLSTLLAFGVALLFILKILPSFDQQNWLSICLISPVVFTIAWTWRGLMFKKNQVK